MTSTSATNAVVESRTQSDISPRGLSFAFDPAPQTLVAPGRDGVQAAPDSARAHAAGHAHR